MKKVLSVLLSIVVIFALGGCGSKQAAVVNDKKVIIVGASPIPHAEILEAARPVLAKEGYTLKIVQFTDYVTPNTALAQGQLDANFFQHVPYLNEFCKEKGLNLTWTVKVEIEPMALYSNKYKKLSDIKNGASIAIPNDPTNEARALKVLEKAGLIKVKSGDLVSVLDITSNPKKLKITELDAPQLPRILKDMDAAVINSNYALEAKLKVSDALEVESKNSPYANVLAVRTEDKNKPYIKALSKALTSPEVKKFILAKYKGAVIPAF